MAAFAPVLKSRGEGPTMQYLFGALVATAALVGCAAQPTQRLTETPAPDANIGTKRWIANSVYICAGPPAPSEITTIGATPCVPTKSGVFTVEGTTKGKVVNGYIIKFDSGRTGWIEQLDLKLWTDDSAAHGKKLAEKAVCDKRGGVRVGMSREQIYASCWGKPRTINKTVGAYGVHEQLVYGDLSYLYLENGILRSIQTTEQ